MYRSNGDFINMSNINIEKLDEICKMLPNLLSDKNEWKSLKINKHEPVIHRLYMELNENCTIILHKIFPCQNHKPLMHSHSWPFAVHVVEGGYEMSVGFSKNREDVPEPVYRTHIAAGDKYEMLSSDIWHTTKVNDKSIYSYSIMIIGKRWRERLAQNNDPLDENEFDHLYNYFLDWSNKE